jgi:hypothetical protein
MVVVMVAQVARWLCSRPSVGSAEIIELVGAHITRSTAIHVQIEGDRSTNRVRHTVQKAPQGAVQTVRSLERGPFGCVEQLPGVFDACVEPEVDEKGAQIIRSCARQPDRSSPTAAAVHARTPGGSASAGSVAGAEILPGDQDSELGGVLL